MKATNEEIIDYLLKVKSDLIIGLSIRDFCQSGFIVVSDLPIIVNQIKDQIRDNEKSMLSILGLDSLNFFKNLTL